MAAASKLSMRSHVTNSRLVSGDTVEWYSLVLIGHCAGNSYISEVSYLNLGRTVDRTSDFYPVFPRS